MTVKKDFPYGDHCAIIIQIDGKSEKTDKGEILMKHVKTVTEHNQDRWMWRVPDIMPVCM